MGKINLQSLIVSTPALFLILFSIVNYNTTVSGYKLNKFSPKKYHYSPSSPSFESNNLLPKWEEPQGVVLADDKNKLQNDVGNYFMEEEDEEPECPKNFWFHVRGQRCVPLKCPGGNKMRVPETGKCIRKSLRRFNKGPILFFSSSSSHRRFIPSRNLYGGPMRGLGMMNF